MSNTLALSESEIEDLRARGFYVERAADTESSGFIWRHRHGASQLIDTPHQPPRRSAAQAWYDCARYDALDVNPTTEPDWEKP